MRLSASIRPTAAVDDAWSAGYVGLYRQAGGSSIQQYNDVKIGYDNNGDGDILDAGDDIQVSDDFNSATMSLTYDNNGNLTDDGVLRYVYDAWNRLRKAQRYADGDTTTIAEYKYLADNRRASKLVQNCGIEAVANDGGNTTVHFYYGSNQSRDRQGAVGGAGVSPVNWNIFETRNGSNQATRQWVWGTRYVDELLFMDVNGSPPTDNDCDPDTTVGGLESGSDRRYFYHQDRNWNVVALTEYADGVGTNGRVAERYAYTPYGEFVVLKGDGGSGELGRASPASSVGNPFAHQGLPFDREKGSYQNRHRDCEASTARFAQADSIGYVEASNLYIVVRARPTSLTDPSGNTTCCANAVPDCCNMLVHCPHSAGCNDIVWHLTGANQNIQGKCVCAWENARRCSYWCECTNPKQGASCTDWMGGTDKPTTYATPDSAGNCDGPCAATPPTGQAPSTGITGECVG